MKKIYEWIAGIFAVLLGIIAFLFTKKQSAEALLQNQKTKEEINQQNQVISKDQGLLDAEAATRQQIQEQETKKKESHDSLSDLNDYFNNK